MTIINGEIPALGVTFDSWNGIIHLPQNIVENKTPKFLNGSFYVWSGRRAKPSTIETVTFTDSGEEMIDTIYSAIGYVHQIKLQKTGGLYTYWMRLVDATAQYFPGKSTQNTKGFVNCTLTGEFSKISEGSISDLVTDEEDGSAIVDPGDFV